MNDLFSLDYALTKHVNLKKLKKPYFKNTSVVASAI